MRGIRKSLEGRPRHALGQFFTPKMVADFAAQTLLSLGALRDASRVIDPTAGEGVFLDAVRRVAPVPLNCVGLDIDRALTSSTVHLGNGLLDHPSLDVREEAFDLCVGNPPYGGLGLHGIGRLASGEEDAATWDVANAVLRSELWRAANDGADTPPEFAARVLTPRLRRTLERVARFPVENLFMERFVRLLRNGGWLAVVVPEGVLANARAAFVREWMARHGRVEAVIGLPRVFSRAGASAKTALLFYRRDPESDGPVRLSDPGMEWRKRGDALRSTPDLSSYLQSPPRVEVDWGILRHARWDPRYWDPRYAFPLEGIACGRLAPLGDFISHMTYGPIVTRLSPSAFPGDVAVVGQGQIEESGVNLAACTRVQSGCVFDPPRSRAKTRDLLFPRSGAGSLGRNRLAVYEEHKTANVGCFVNVIRLEGINPYFVWLFLKTRFGWGQLRRIINGVGMPNISFDEIRGLLIPQVSESLSQAVEDAYASQVRPAHRALVSACRSGDANVGEDARTVAHKRFAALVASLERALSKGFARLEA